MFKARPAGPASLVAEDGRPSSESLPRESSTAGVTRAFAASTGLLARLVYFVLSVVVAIIAAGILLALLRANPANSVVSEVHGWGRWLTAPFDGMFSFHQARVAVAVNWGIAAVLYLFAGALIARLIGRPHNRRPIGRSAIPNQEGS
jgi:hypothetical protein